MNDLPPLQLGLSARIRSRSMGMKLIVVCGLALLMMIPAIFVRELVQDRTNRAADVIRDISQQVGGQQTFLGPTLAIPYSIAAKNPSDSGRARNISCIPRASQRRAQDNNRRTSSVPFQGSSVPGRCKPRRELQLNRSTGRVAARRRSRLEPGRDDCWSQRYARGIVECNADD